MERKESRPDDGFGQYRKLCSGEHYRKTGIIDEGAYNLAIQDTRTVFSVVDPDMPLITPIEYVDGYDHDRVQRMVGSDDVGYLAQPIRKLAVEDTRELVEHIKNGEVVLVEDCTDEFRGENAGDVEFHNVWGDSEDPAWIGIYAAVGELLDQGEPSEEESKYCRVYSGEEIAKKPQIAEECWDIFKDKFGWLGENHPVSMEDTREFFESVMYDPETYTGVRFSEDGEIVAASLFMHSFRQCEWLEVASMPEIQPGEDERMLYFFGVVAKKAENTLKFARDLLRYQCYWEARRGKDCKLIFESSELSSQYIPDLVETYINSTGAFKIPKPEIVAKKTYSYLKAKA